MKKTMNKYIYVLGLSLFSFSGMSQVTNDFEVGSRNHYKTLCWQFYSTSVNGGSNAFSGPFSARTGQLSNNPYTNPSTNFHQVISPWVDIPSNGTVAFEAKIKGSISGGKFLNVYLTDQNGTVSSLESQFSFANNSTTYTFNQTAASGGVYQVHWDYYGNGGNGRGLLDNIVISGTDVSEPSNNQGAGNCPTISLTVDTDGDGIPDDDDDYPNDAAKAFDNYYPNPSSYASYAFEDLWPNMGDYDFNDLVIRFRINPITNANNKVVELDLGFKV